MQGDVLRMTDLIGRSVQVSRTIAESDVYLFGGITGDLSRYHIDEALMRETGIGGRVVHGVLLLGHASAASSRFWDTFGGEGRTISYGYDRVRFIRPVLIGTTVTTEYRLTAYDPEAARAESQVHVLNDKGALVLSAVHLTKVTVL